MKNFICRLESKQFHVPTNEIDPHNLDPLTLLVEATSRSNSFYYLTILNFPQSLPSLDIPIYRSQLSKSNFGLLNSTYLSNKNKK